MTLFTHRLKPYAKSAHIQVKHVLSCIEQLSSSSVYFMKQHSMIHAFTYRHIEIFAVLGIGLFLQALQITRAKFAQFAFTCVILFMLSHSLLCVFDYEGLFLKKVVVNTLISDQIRAPWACKQIDRLSTSSELAGVKVLLNGMVSDGCTTKGSSQMSEFNLKASLAEMVIFWR